MIWKNLRVPAHVMLMLEKYRSNLQKAVDHRPEAYPEHYCVGRLSLGTAIERLLESQSLHRERQKRYEQRHGLNGRRKLPAILQESNQDEAEAGDCPAR